jgi:hypothetical protein
MSNFKSLMDYFNHNNTFVVPYYQRGYKWSLQKNPKKGDLHLSLLLSDLKSEFQIAQKDGVLIKNHEYYLQGITVKERNNEIELVDGQQRTTSLFILFCALKHKKVELKFNLEGKLKYNVRESANVTLQGFLKGVCEGDEKVQDIAALKKAWNICLNEIENIENLDLYAEFLQNNIKIIYIRLNDNQNEAKVFSMMNKDKADMTQADLIKSNILREASRQFYNGITENQHNDGLEWQINQLRTKLAVDWDNWRKWWENEKHLSFCKMISMSLPPIPKESNLATEPNLSYLLNLYLKLNNPITQSAGLFEYFKDIIADKEEIVIEAIEVFEKLRYFQNILVEWYNDEVIYNYLGLLFKGCGMKNKEEKLFNLLNKYSEDKQNFVEELKNEYINQILNDNTKEQFIESLLNDEDVYHNQYANVARQLLRMNVLRTIKQKQKFDFSLYEEETWQGEEVDNRSSRSLEHIKSQTYVDDKLTEEQMLAIEALTNTIGNLVLIPKGLNSKLSNRSFDIKKQIVFDEMLKPEGKNYGLWLHSLAIFGSNIQFVAKEIDSNKLVFKNEFYSFFKN